MAYAEGAFVFTEGMWKRIPPTQKGELHIDEIADFLAAHIDIKAKLGLETVS